ncbi:unnamed protein product [Rotaria sp. Silwood2]|nr:unnamed protein product [Rotaria sp. Silwood2]CAF2862918.1 unnamed protein product [Rotaria sp. Silwood2]CAF3087549.1 unnamed protein product [Rotaria sp. Silwood2]CAF4124266.1 unnamed protein product [Rotaria sp. Silwood2]CAF4275666.1 unnamed protein product [Rotaria sp. Silwood2]
MKKLLEKNQFGAPQNHINGRLQDPPQLRGPTIEILGTGEEEAAEDQQQNEDNDKYQTNELEMIINEKLWKDEQIKHRRRAKRT